MIPIAWWLACTAARPPVDLPAPASTELRACQEGEPDCAPFLRTLDIGDDVEQRRAAALRHLRCADGDVDACRWWVDEAPSGFPGGWRDDAQRRLCDLDPASCPPEAALWDLGRDAVLRAWSVRDRDLVVAEGTRVVVWDGLGDPVVGDLAERPLAPPAIGALSAIDGTLRAAIDPSGLARPTRDGIPLLPVLDGRRIRWVGEGVRICGPFGRADADGFVATVGDRAACPPALSDAPRARFDWDGREIERVEGLASAVDATWQLLPLDPPPVTGRAATVELDVVTVRERDGTVVMRTLIHPDCVVEDALVSGDGSRLFVIGFPGHLHVFHLADDPRPGPGLQAPSPPDDWLRRGAVDRPGTLVGQLPGLGGAPPVGPVVVESEARVDGEPQFAVRADVDGQGRFAVDVPFGEYVVRGAGFSAAARVFGARVEVVNEAPLVDAALGPGDALHVSGRPLLADAPVTVQVEPPAVIERADGRRQATDIWGGWTEVQDGLSRDFQIQWDDGTPIAGAEVLEQARDGSFHRAYGTAADALGRGWVVTPSQPPPLRVDGPDGAPTWPIEPEPVAGRLVWSVPRGSVRVVGMRPGQHATLSRDGRDLTFAFAPDGAGWRVSSGGAERRTSEVRLDHVPPGRWTLTAWDPDGRAALEAIDLTEGESVTVRPGWAGAGTLEVYAVDPEGRRVPGATVRVVTGLETDGWRAETDEVGRATIDGLPPGRATVHVADHATRLRAVVSTLVEARRAIDVVAEVRVPARLADHPGVRLGRACVVLDPGRQVGRLEVGDRLTRFGDLPTDRWTPDACLAALQDGDAPREVLVRSAVDGTQRAVWFDGPPRCLADGRCVQTTRRGERAVER